MHTPKITATCLLTVGLSISGCNSLNSNTDADNKTSSVLEQWISNLVDYVNPFIGTKGVYTHYYILSQREINNGQ